MGPAAAGVVVAHRKKILDTYLAGPHLAWQLLENASMYLCIHFMPRLCKCVCVSCCCCCTFVCSRLATSEGAAPTNGQWDYITLWFIPFWTNTSTNTRKGKHLTEHTERIRMRAAERGARGTRWAATMDTAYCGGGRPRRPMACGVDRDTNEKEQMWSQCSISAFLGESEAPNHCLYVCLSV